MIKMKRIFFYFFILVSLNLIFILGCKHDYNNTIHYSNQGPNVTDIDGNVYKSVVIGTQTWMSENLKVLHYRNGDIIPNIADSIEWNNLATGAYCYYNNDPINYNVYGSLYNWYAVKDSRNIAPIGWHVPTNAEWLILTNYLGGESLAGGKLKETGTSHWISPNTGADNSSGFTGLPGGYRIGDVVTFGQIGEQGGWWSSSEGSNIQDGLFLSIMTSFKFANSYGNPKRFGYSVRCVKD